MGHPTTLRMEGMAAADQWTRVLVDRRTSGPADQWTLRLVQRNRQSGRSKAHWCPNFLINGPVPPRPSLFPTEDL